MEMADVIEQARAKGPDLIGRGTDVRWCETELDEAREIAEKEQHAVDDESNAGSYDEGGPWVERSGTSLHVHVSHRPTVLVPTTPRTSSRETHHIGQAVATRKALMSKYANEPIVSPSPR